ncbi:MAG: DUF3267 domain-containing protein [bacterium]|nr:DUF3267 domain-containing protein [bacterium]
MKTYAKTCAELPENYRELFAIDLKKDKKLFMKVNGLALAISAVLVVIGLFLSPTGVFVDWLFDMEQGFLPYMLRFVGLIAAIALYMVLHEVVHGVCMKHFSGVKPHYGFNLAYAYAGSSAYFNKKHYLIIALAPVVVWGVVLSVISCMVPEEMFWFVYLIQIINLSGAAGDIYVTQRFSSLPDDILVNDTGFTMTVYGKA